MNLSNCELYVVPDNYVEYGSGTFVGTGYPAYRRFPAVTGFTGGPTAST
jgi:hypothetical protein